MSNTKRIPARPEFGDVRAVSVFADLKPTDPDALPVSVIQILPFGDVRIRDARENFVVSDVSVMSILSYFGKDSVDLAIDYDHGMYYGDNNEAAGWGEKMWAMVPADVHDRIAPFIEQYGDRVGLISSENEEDWGVYLFVRWTQSAAEKIQNREYRYVSPVVFFAFNGEANYIWNAAIVNNPAIDGMDALAASYMPASRPEPEPENDDTEAGEGDALATEPEINNEEEEMEFLKAFAASVRPEVNPEDDGFDAEAFMSEVAEELTSLRETATNHETLAAEHEQVKVELEESQALATEQDATIKELNEKLGERDAEAHKANVETAIENGKIAESQRDWAMEHEDAFNSLLETLGDEQKLGPPQGKDIEAESEEALKADGPVGVEEIRAYAKEHDLTFEKAFVELRKAGK